jgi:hypothetical protein
LPWDGKNKIYKFKWFSKFKYLIRNLKTVNLFPEWWCCNQNRKLLLEVAKLESQLVFWNKWQSTWDRYPGSEDKYCSSTFWSVCVQINQTNIFIKILQIKYFTTLFRAFYYCLLRRLSRSFLLFCCLSSTFVSKLKSKAKSCFVDFSSLFVVELLVLT